MIATWGFAVRQIIKWKPRSRSTSYYCGRSFHIYLVGSYPTVPMFPQSVVIVASPSYEAFHLMHIPSEKPMLALELTATDSMNGEDRQSESRMAA